MKEISIKEIEIRVKRNSEANKDKVEKFENDSKEKGLKRGRVRPRDPTEQKILDSFEKR